MTLGEPSAGPALPGPPQFNAIPVWDSVKAAFAAVQGDLESFFVAARIWVLVLGVLGGATLSLAAGAEPGGASGFAFAVAIVRIVGTAAFLVAWHRHVLLAETIAPMGAVKIGRREGRFVLYELVPAVLIALVFLAACDQSRSLKSWRFLWRLSRWRRSPFLRFRCAGFCSRRSPRSMFPGTSWPIPGIFRGAMACVYSADFA